MNVLTDLFILWEDSMLIFLLLLTDGSALEVSMKTATVEMKTKYGDIAVPFEDIRSVEFGLHYPDGLKERIDKLIQNLNNPDFKVRDAATNELISLNVHAKASLSNPLENLEAEKRRQKILKDLETVPTPVVMDKINISGTTFHGHIRNVSFDMDSKVFGPTKLPITVLRKAISRKRKEEIVKLLPKKEWLTVMDIEAGDKIKIVADGRVDLFPSTPNMYMSTPSGYTNNATFEGKSASAGLLMVRYNGNLIDAGNGATFTAGVRGKLELLIWPSPWNNESSGHYDVKIERE